MISPDQLAADKELCERIVKSAQGPTMDYTWAVRLRRVISTVEQQAAEIERLRGLLREALPFLEHDENCADTPLPPYAALDGLIIRIQEALK